VVTRIEQDGTMQRRVVDAAQCDDCLQWGRLAARAMEFPPPYRPVPGIPVYHVSVDAQVVLVAEQDLGGPLLNLVTAVLALGEEVLARSSCPARGEPMTPLPRATSGSTWIGLGSRVALLTSDIDTNGILLITSSCWDYAVRS
jgi:hypothetical protein